MTLSKRKGWPGKIERQKIIKYSNFLLILFIQVCSPRIFKDSFTSESEGTPGSKKNTTNYPVPHIFFSHFIL